MKEREVSIADTLEYGSIRRFKHEAKRNMAKWFREFLRNHSSKKFAKNNYLAPLKAFTKFMKSALRNKRPEGASGLEKGEWKLPCGLKCAKAWKLFEKLFAQLRANMMPAMKDAALKQPSCKGRFQIVPAEPNPTELVRRCRRPPSSAGLELVNGQWVRVINPESFLRRPMLDGPVKKGAVNRNEKRGQTKPRAHSR